MKISTVAPTKEFLTIGKVSSPTTGPAEVIYREFNPQRPIPLPNTVSLESVIKENDADPKKAKYLSDARKKLSGTLYADEPETLSALRLASGLSQMQLSKMVETSQPHLARIERGQNDPGTELIARIANALNVDDAAVFRAIRNQLATRGNG